MLHECEQCGQFWLPLRSNGSCSSECVGITKYCATHSYGWEQTDEFTHWVDTIQKAANHGA